MSGTNSKITFTAKNELGLSASPYDYLGLNITKKTEYGSISVMPAVKGSATAFGGFAQLEYKTDKFKDTGLSIGSRFRACYDKSVEDGTENFYLTERITLDYAKDIAEDVNLYTKLGASVKYKTGEDAGFGDVTPVALLGMTYKGILSGRVKPYLEAMVEYADKNFAPTVCLGVNLNLNW